MNFSRELVIMSLPYVVDTVAQVLAVAVIAFSSQTTLLTDHRDSPIAVILFATSSILLFTLPRVGSNSHLPHLLVVIFGLTTVLGLLFDVIQNECDFGSIVGKPPPVPADPALCTKAAWTWWLDLLLFLWILFVLVWNIKQSRRTPAEETPPHSHEEERNPLLG